MDVSRRAFLTRVPFFAAGSVAALLPGCGSLVNEELPAGMPIVEARLQGSGLYVPDLWDALVEAQGSWLPAGQYDGLVVAKVQRPDGSWASAVPVGDTSRRVSSEFGAGDLFRFQIADYALIPVASDGPQSPMEVYRLHDHLLSHADRAIFWEQSGGRLLRISDPEVQFEDPARIVISWARS